MEVMILVTDYEQLSALPSTFSLPITQSVSAAVDVNQYSTGCTATLLKDIKRAYRRTELCRLITSRPNTGSR